MRNLRTIRACGGALLVALALVAWGGRTAWAADTASEKTLYQRLGGYDALAAVTDDFIGRLVKDAAIAPFFKGHSHDSLKRVRQLIVDQLCALTGGPCYYIGRDMRTAHAGMGISQANWDGAVKHLVATLDHFKVPEKEKGEVLAAVSATHDDIVEAK